MICSGVLRFPWLIVSSKFEVHIKPKSLNKHGPLFQWQANSLCQALWRQSLTDLENELDTWPGEVDVIGNCVSPRTANEAVLEGLRAGVTV
jgi:hypothetical protein